MTPQGRGTARHPAPSSRGAGPPGGGPSTGRARRSLTTAPSGEFARRGARGRAPAMSALRIACLSLLTLGLLAPAAVAKAPAPGAPGAKHTWAPADKHGFGTAKKLRSNVWFTLRKAELTEAYYPDLGTPSLRSLEFVVTDGTFVDRETGPGVRSHVTALGGLSYRQTTRTSRWVLRKTWIA